MQNRNSQRIYRQRRVEERKKFEDRAVAAEQAAEKTKENIRELQNMVNSLREQVHRLQDENLALRSGTKSMAWESSSVP